MERAEAAEFLGVSLSTLDRFASQGRLKRGRGKGKTKPVTVFDEQELIALKGQLQESKPQEVFRRLNTPVQKQNAVGFRLDPFYVQKLKELGETQGLSAGEYARKLVIRGLENHDPSEDSGQVRALRGDLAQMFYSLLVTKLDSSEEEAKIFVRKYMGGE